MNAKKMFFKLLDKRDLNVAFQVYAVRDLVKKLTGVWLSDTTASRYLREYRELHKKEFGLPNTDKRHGMYRKERKVA